MTSFPRSSDNGSYNNQKMSRDLDKSNPFYGDNDNDFGFGGRSGGGGRYGASSGGRFETFDDLDDEFAKAPPPMSQHERLQQVKQQSMGRQLDSTKRAMASIYDSESMGIATAEELVHQGEQLDNVERKVETINQDMKVTQRHLTSIKSVFGGLRNWWAGNKDEKRKPDDQIEKPPPKTSSRLSAALEQERPRQEHPALKLRSEDLSGFYEDGDDFGQRGGGSSAYSSGGGYSQIQTSSTSARQAYEEELDSNLDLMSSGMSRLKGLSLGLGDEISRQNEQLDRIDLKTDRADRTISDQNRQMRGILGVKKSDK